MVLMLLNAFLLKRAAGKDPRVIQSEVKLVKMLALAGVLVILIGLAARLNGYELVKGVEGAGIFLILLAGWQSWIVQNINKRKSLTPPDENQAGR